MKTPCFPSPPRTEGKPIHIPHLWPGVPGHSTKLCSVLPSFPERLNFLHNFPASLPLLLETVYYKLPGKNALGHLFCYSSINTRVSERSSTEIPTTEKVWRPKPESPRSLSPRSLLGSLPSLQLKTVLPPSTSAASSCLALAGVPAGEPKHRWSEQERQRACKPSPASDTPAPVRCSQLRSCHFPAHPPLLLLHP